MSPVRLSRAFERPEGLLLQHVQVAGLPEPVTQYQATPPRKFAWDLAWPAEGYRLLVDVQGAVWAGGRHTRGAGYEDDTEKWSLATVAGFRVLIVTTRQVEDGRALAWIEAALHGPGYRTRK
jgi:hypothetical protein